MVAVLKVMLEMIVQALAIVMMVLNVKSVTVSMAFPHRYLCPLAVNTLWSNLWSAPNTPPPQG